MSKKSRQFQVPDALANLYDFANTLDVRHFIEHGAPHQQGDELETPLALAAWMEQRRLLRPGAKITPDTFETALRLRENLRDYLQLDPHMRKSKSATRAINDAIATFPLIAAFHADGARLLAAREDTLGGLSVLAAELYDGARDGSLDRLKMCASDECRRVFYDRSKPSTRRWCMSTLCGNRIKTRAYRERQRDAG